MATRQRINEGIVSISHQLSDARDEESSVKAKIARLMTVRRDLVAMVADDDP